MSWVGKLQNNYFLTTKLRQRLKHLGQHMVFAFIVDKMICHRSAKDADDELIVAGVFERKVNKILRKYEPQIRMKLVINHPVFAGGFRDFKLSCSSLDLLFVSGVEKVSGLQEVKAQGADL